MIRRVQRRIHRELSLVLSERTRQDSGLPTGTQKTASRPGSPSESSVTVETVCVCSDLWKKAPLKLSLSPERPQIVETFIQQLMAGAEEADGQVP